MSASIHDAARGRWRDILGSMGLTPAHLSGKHGPCPMCGGNDRWRWDNKAGSGSFYCSHCGAGSGVDLVMKFKGVDFREAKRLIEAEIGTARIITPKAGLNEDQAKAKMLRLWNLGRALDGDDLGSRYLRARGIKTLPPASAVRFIDSLPYLRDDKTEVRFPGLLSKFVAPDARSAILHRTWLAEPGAKADVPSPRKMMAGRIPMGGAVRLAPAAETMGVCEGLETAMTAAELNSISVWACMTADCLMKFEPPKECRNLIIYADRDRSFTGQYKSYALAYRLNSTGWHGLKRGEYSVAVHFPDGERDGETDCDWNDLAEALEAAE
jgi:putative DNA primase/helicase